MTSKKRGANNTVEEKERLRDLVTEYKSIVEDKRTGGEQLKRKREVWQLIAFKFNSSATSGKTDVDALKTLYDNMKQKARKALAEKNKAEYITCGVTKEMLSEAIQKTKEDKRQIRKTGGGSYTPLVTGEDEKILDIIKEQVEPQSNIYDSAAVYFKDLGECVPNAAIPAFKIINEKDMEFTQTIDITDTKDITDIIVGDNNNLLGLEPLSPSNTKGKHKISDSENNLTEGTLNKENSVELKKSKHCESKKTATKKFYINKDTKTTFKHTSESLKKLYLKKKCINATLERKRITQ